MQRNKTFSILTIICFCSIIFIPIGLVTMWFTTQWSKKKKFILTFSMTVLYVAIVTFLMQLEPNPNGKGLRLPFGKGNQNVQTEYFQNSKKSNKKDSDFFSDDSKKRDLDDLDEEIASDEIKLPKKIRKGTKTFPPKNFYTIMFFLFMLFVIIWQNLKSKKNGGGYENPYVDTDQYKLPLNKNSKTPTVHFQKLNLRGNEKILYATETAQKNEEGDFAVTNRRIVVFGKSSDYEFPLSEISSVSSVSNTVMLLKCGERKYYIFLPENQMKYAIATVRMAMLF